MTAHLSILGRQCAAQFMSSLLVFFRPVAQSRRLQN